MLNARYIAGYFIVAAVAMTLFWAGCSVEFDTNREGLFFCETDDDCLGPAFVCDQQDPANPVCVRQSTANEAPPCVDADGDGYGAAGTDRTNCPFPEPDCDDNNPAVNPGATEICDGIDNNCSGSIDVMTCESSAQCPRNQRDSQGNPVVYHCEEVGQEQSKHCVARPINQICDPVCPECAQILYCREGTLDTVPPACR